MTRAAFLYSGGVRLRFLLLLVAGMATTTRLPADFWDATKVHQYNSGIFPLDAKPVPGTTNLLGVIDKLGRVDLLNVGTNSVYDYSAQPGQQPFLQLPVDSYTLFNDDGEVPGLFAHWEAGLLGIAFHPSFSAAPGTLGRGKLYLNLTVDNIVNPNGASVPIYDPLNPGVKMIDTSDGIDGAEVTYVNTVVDPMDNIKFLEKCYACEYGSPEARLTDLDGDLQNDDFDVWCGAAGQGKRPFSINKQLYSEVREYTVDFHGSTDASQWTVDGVNYKTVMRFPRRREFHNGGWIDFGPDGKLYLASGDSQGSPYEAFNSPAEPIAQPGNPAADFFGKILRIDVNTNLNNPPLADGSVENYLIPSDNPFASGGAQMTATPDDDEVFAYGLRNPWRASFDPNGNMWIADVGFGSPQQGGYYGAEEVNLVPAGQWGGQNFGWPYYEGGPTGSAGDTGTAAPPPARITHLGADPNNVPAGIVEPEYFYFTSLNARGSIIGGFVYDGPDETLQGQYIFYDNVRRQVWSYDRSKPPAERVSNISHKLFRDGYDNVYDSNDPDMLPDYPLPNGVADVYPRDGNLANLTPVIGLDPASWVGAFVGFSEDGAGNLYLVSLSERNVFRLNYAGDFNRDMMINATDIDLLAAAAQLANPTVNELTTYDVHGDMSMYGDGVLEYSIGAAGMILSDSDRLVRQLVEIRNSMGNVIGHGTEYGDTDLDGDIDTVDITATILNFSGAGNGGRHWATGDFDGDGDNDTVDITTVISKFTGAGSGASTAAALAREWEPPTLIYDARTGDVVVDPGSETILSFSLQSDGFFSASAEFGELDASVLAGVVSAFVDNTADQIGWVSVAALAQLGLDDAETIGMVLPAGLSDARLYALLRHTWAGPHGAGGSFELVVIPEPSSLLLSVLAVLIYVAVSYRQRQLIGTLVSQLTDD